MNVTTTHLSQSFDLLPLAELPPADSNTFRIGTEATDRLKSAASFHNFELPTLISGLATFKNDYL